jgi:ring-1,2-phenylacetyl-CoA epoxidase subunit PaaD
MISKNHILDLLHEVKDPEIPVLSLVDLGVVREIETYTDRTVITITPTFVGCPALEIMKQEIIDVLQKNGIVNPVVNVSLKQPWSSNLISEKGKAALKSFGLAPPPTLIDDISVLEHVACPNCGSENTELRTPFGPTLCRSLHFCHSCGEAFEQFKPL